MKRSFLLPAALVAFAAAPVFAQSGDAGGINFRVGGFFPSANSEFWDVNRDIYTLDKSDFNDGIVGFSWLVPVNNNLEVGVNIDAYDSSVRAADRDFQDQDGFPILHDTNLRLVPVTVDLRILPGGRYHQRGRGGRISVRKPVPYFGVGGGVNFWQYEEVGDFVAFDPDPIVVFDRAKDSGATFVGHVLAGVEIPVGPQWGVSFEGRYSWSEATPSGPFSDFDQGKLDLGGFALFVGGTLRF